MKAAALTNKFERLRDHKSFELLVMAIIIFSALVIGVKTYDMPPYLISVVGWLDTAITIFFVFEISIRFIGEEIKRDFFKSGWNIFDLVIVLVSIIPIEGGDMALVGRLIRIFRVLRMVSLIPELRVLLDSLIKALPQLGYVVALMFIIFYIYAAVGSTIFQDINEDLWGDVSISMLTLFRVMTFEDWTDVMYETMEVYPLSWMYYLSFIFFTTFAFLNMVIGIVVNVLEQENAAARDIENPQPDLAEIMQQIEELKVLLQRK
ncbi:MAG: ion transporter [Gammaproteobacteria bacterium]|nr:ion transporter [Gammaproteobacteria bacterium]